MSIARGTLFNLAGAAVPILVSLATVPLYLDLIGAERFGVLSLCWLLLGQFGAFDLGLGRAVTHRVARLGSGTAAERNEIFWTALWASLPISLAIAALTVPAILYLTAGAGPGGIGNELATAIPWLVAAVPVALASSVLTGAMIGRERFGILNIVETLSNTAIAVLPLLASLLTAPTLTILIAASLVGRLILVIMLLVALRKALPLLRPTGLDAGLALSLLRFGGWVAVCAAVGPLLAYWDRFAIGAILDATAVSIYVIPTAIALRLLLIPTALARTLLPRLSAASEAEAAETIRQSLLALAAVITPITLGCIVMADPFLQLWVGDEIGRQSAVIAVILLPGIWFNALAFLPFTVLLARERARSVAMILFAEALPHAALFFVLISTLGLPGAALAWTIRMTADALILYWRMGASRRELAVLVPSVAALLICAGAAVSLDANAPARWIVLIAVAGAGSLLAMRNVPEPMRLWLRARLRLRTGG